MRTSKEVLDELQLTASKVERMLSEPRETGLFTWWVSLDQLLGRIDALRNEKSHTGAQHARFHS